MDVTQNRLAEVVMTSNRELARKHFREGLGAAADEAVADEIYNEVKAAWRKMRDAAIPRPRLKFEVQREGSTFKHADKILTMFDNMTKRGVRDHVQVAKVLKEFRGEVNRSSLYELIDASSDCAYPRNKERLLAFLKRTESA
jgi:hypothetical protein